MFFILSKILFFFIQPLVWIFILLVVALFSSSPVRRKQFLIATLIVTLFFSNQFIFNEFISAWENSTPLPNTSKTNYEVAIVLGGVSSFDNERNQHRFHSNAERILNILPLYFEGSVKKILLAGGSGSLTKNEREADVLKTYLLSIGVKEKDLLIERESRNTYENAKNSVELLQKEKIKGKVLLSTSAIHMPRAYACFVKQGLKPTAFPVDHFGSKESKFSLDKLLMPKPDVIDHWYYLIHEWVGMLSYKLTGYC